MNRAAQHDELLGELASKRARLKSDPWRFSELVAQADLACGQNDSVQDGALQLDQVATDVQARVEVIRSMRELLAKQTAQAVRKALQQTAAEARAKPGRRGARGKATDGAGGAGARTSSDLATQEERALQAAAESAGPSSVKWLTGDTTSISLDPRVCCRQPELSNTLDRLRLHFSRHQRLLDASSDDDHQRPPHPNAHATTEAQDKDRVNDETRPSQAVCALARLIAGCAGQAKASHVQGTVGDNPSACEMLSWDSDEEGGEDIEDTLAQIPLPSYLRTTVLSSNKAAPAPPPTTAPAPQNPLRMATQLTAAQDTVRSAMQVDAPTSYRAEPLHTHLAEADYAPSGCPGTEHYTRANEAGGTVVDRPATVQGRPATNTAAVASARTDRCPPPQPPRVPAVAAGANTGAAAAAVLPQPAPVAAAVATLARIAPASVPSPQVPVVAGELATAASTPAPPGRLGDAPANSPPNPYPQPQPTHSPEADFAATDQAQDVEIGCVDLGVSGVASERDCLSELAELPCAALESDDDETMVPVVTMGAGHGLGVTQHRAATMGAGQGLGVTQHAVRPTTGVSSLAGHVGCATGPTAGVRGGAGHAAGTAGRTAGTIAHAAAMQPAAGPAAGNNAGTQGINEALGALVGGAVMAAAAPADSGIKLPRRPVLLSRQRTHNKYQQVNVHEATAPDKPDGLLDVRTVEDIDMCSDDDTTPQQRDLLHAPPQTTNTTTDTQHQPAAVPQHGKQQSCIRRPQLLRRTLGRHGPGHRDGTAVHITGHDEEPDDIESDDCDAPLVISRTKVPHPNTTENLATAHHTGPAGTQRGGTQATSNNHNTTDNLTTAHHTDRGAVTPTGTQLAASQAKARPVILRRRVHAAGGLLQGGVQGSQRVQGTAAEELEESDLDADDPQPHTTHTEQGASTDSCDISSDSSDEECERRFSQSHVGGVSQGARGRGGPHAGSQGTAGGDGGDGVLVGSQQQQHGVVKGASQAIAAAMVVDLSRAGRAKSAAALRAKAGAGVAALGSEPERLCLIPDLSRQVLTALDPARIMNPPGKAKQKIRYRPVHTPELLLTKLPTYPSLTHLTRLAQDATHKPALPGPTYNTGSIANGALTTSADGATVTGSIGPASVAGQQDTTVQQRFAAGLEAGKELIRAALGAEQAERVFSSWPPVPPPPPLLPPQAPQPQPACAVPATAPVADDADWYDDDSIWEAVEQAVASRTHTQPQPQPSLQPLQPQPQQPQLQAQLQQLPQQTKEQGTLQFTSAWQQLTGAKPPDPTTTTTLPTHTDHVMLDCDVDMGVHTNTHETSVTKGAPRGPVSTGMPPPPPPPQQQQRQFQAASLLTGADAAGDGKGKGSKGRAGLTQPPAAVRAASAAMSVIDCFDDLLRDAAPVVDSAPTAVAGGSAAGASAAAAAAGGVRGGTDKYAQMRGGPAPVPHTTTHMGPPPFPPHITTRHSNHQHPFGVETTGRPHGVGAGVGTGVGWGGRVSGPGMPHGAVLGARMGQDAGVPGVAYGEGVSGVGMGTGLSWGRRVSGPAMSASMAHRGAMSGVCVDMAYRGATAFGGAMSGVCVDMAHRGAIAHGGGVSGGVGASAGYGRGLPNVCADMGVCMEAEIEEVDVECSEDEAPGDVVGGHDAADEQQPSLGGLFGGPLGAEDTPRTTLTTSQADTCVTELAPCEIIFDMDEDLDTDAFMALAQHRLDALSDAQLRATALAMQCADVDIDMCDPHADKCDPPAEMCDPHADTMCDQDASAGWRGDRPAWSEPDALTGQKHHNTHNLTAETSNGADTTGVGPHGGELTRHGGDSVGGVLHGMGVKQHGSGEGLGGLETGDAARPPLALVGYKAVETGTCVHTAVTHTDARNASHPQPQGTHGPLPGPPMPAVGQPGGGEDSAVPGHMGGAAKPVVQAATGQTHIVGDDGGLTSRYSIAQPAVQVATTGQGSRRVMMSAKELLRQRLLQEILKLHARSRVGLAALMSHLADALNTHIQHAMSTHSTHHHGPLTDVHTAKRQRLATQQHTGQASGQGGGQATNKATGQATGHTSTSVVELDVPWDAIVSNALSNHREVFGDLEVTPQRLFLALLSLAHRTNVAAATAAAAAATEVDSGVGDRAAAATAKQQALLLNTTIHLCSPTEDDDLCNDAPSDACGDQGDASDRARAQWRSGLTLRIRRSL